MKIKSIRIVLTDTLPSWNKFHSRGHWSQRTKIVDYWRELVRWEILKDKKRIQTFTKPVTILITCYYKNLNCMIDADNICAKIAIDGLKGLIITDDDWKYVDSVTTQSRLDRTRPRTEIFIQEI